MKLKFATACVAIAGLAVALAAKSEASLQVNWTGATKFVGTVDPDAPPGSLVAEADKINKMIGVLPSTSEVIDSKTYTRSDLDVLFDPVDLNLDYFKQDNGNTTLSLGNLAAQYIFGKYGNVGYVWYCEEGFTGDIVLPATAGGNGLSHSSAFNVVPEAGSLIVWGGLALTGLCLCRRKLVS
ncbi:hypothetical protein NG895_27925 [Aeoliella sp. ICT_H6.2]|uniref:PEP-CTERM protein-sorting domain-containing protein n=1 Tax=Aeoliella straminimaris TaxID=2954799 RepID=A0A9X2FET0_9BACT|nr:hypothetical protein [Aeoliella straminimaris]MCO6047750.1 hypothetical protein [Aeoliella straminimaris]